MRNLRDSNNNRLKKIYVRRTNIDTDSLPKSFTCSMTIELPIYPTYEILERRFDTAIRQKIKESSCNK